MQPLQQTFGQSIHSEYHNLKAVRDTYLSRAVQYSQYSIRSIMPAMDNTNVSGAPLSVRYNTIGPMLVNHLANKYATTLFPAVGPFFKLDLEDEVKARIVKSDNNPSGTEGGLIEHGLSMIEQRSRKEFDKLNSRPAVLEAVKHLIVTGNALLAFPKEADKTGKVQLYALDEYVVQRDLSANVLCMILRDSKNITTLDPAIRAQVLAIKGIAPEHMLHTVDVDLFTKIELQPDGKWHVTQAVEEIPVGELEVVKPENLRWVPLTWNTVRREVYGRGHIEDYASIFHALEILNEAVVTNAAVTLDLKFLVRPASQVDVNAMNNSATGTFHLGEPGDVSVVEKAMKGDMNAISNLIQRLESILYKAFLYNVPRDSERTTAEEVRLSAQELETSHGGVFGTLANTLQLPFAKYLLQRVDSTIAKTAVVPEIITGLDAMGRGSLNDQIMQCFMAMQQVMQTPAEVLKMMRVDPGALFNTFAANYSVDHTLFTYTKEEAQQQAQQEAEQQKASMMDEAQAKGSTPEEIERMKQQQSAAQADSL